MGTYFNNTSSQDVRAHASEEFRTNVRCFLALKGLSLFPVSFSAPQINGIALDNKSVTECEALLRSCRDSLSLSLMKVRLTRLLIFLSPSPMPKILRKFIPLVPELTRPS